MRRALDEYNVDGIKTTLPFFRAIMRDDEFIAGRLDTGFITRFNERHAQRLEQAKAEETSAEAIEQRDVALIAAALDYERRQKQTSSNHQPGTETQSRWRLNGRAALLNSRA
jgi:acetyl/propionyl-CoA carboxylase alpha subunit